MTDKQRVILCEKLGIESGPCDHTCPDNMGDCVDCKYGSELVYPVGLALMDAYEQALVAMDGRYSFGIEYVWSYAPEHWAASIRPETGVTIRRMGKSKQDAFEAALWCAFGEEEK